ncbi:hypothetical protein AGMMS49965_22600 [Bacteroidia bacterium]|nr:hypothetical protein AGMMS49965_22600 [Bacteroidia bacterium]
MKKFIVRVLLLVSPFILVGIDYCYLDPFKVLYKYSNYNEIHGLVKNRDYVSTEMFMNNYKKQGYNSFIFGSSRTVAFKPSSWQQYLLPTDSPFLFDASGESIYGIYVKMKYLDSMHVTIDNALIILCRDASFQYSNDHEGHLFMKHPVLTGKNKFDFQLMFFGVYLNPMLLLSYHDYKLTKKFKPYMSGYMENREIVSDTITNWQYIISQENEILNAPEKYYEERKDLFYEREHEQTDTRQRINSEYIGLLKEIKQILEKHQTNYKIVLSPLYDQMKFHPKDMDILTNLFGNHLYDFSGKNSFTDNKTNYYETSHFRPLLGDSILMQIY